MGWKRADRPSRLRLIADEYGLDQDGRTELLGAVDDALDRIETTARRWVDVGESNVAADLTKTGGIEKYDRRRAWWKRHHDDFSLALR